MTKKIVYGTITSIAFVIASLTIPTFLLSQEASAGMTIACFLSNAEPIDPLEVRVEEFGNIGKIKTLIVEKEVFDCEDSSTEQSFARDITIIIDILENKNGKELKTSISVLNCDKLIFDGGNTFQPFPECALQSVENTLSGELVNCINDKTFVEVGSTSFEALFGTDTKQITKFVIVEKEILLCDSILNTGGGPDRVLEIFNIEEFFNKNALTQKVIICEKDILKGTVLACQDFNP